MIEVVDAMDRQVRLARPAERVVSLVPSETASVADLAGVERLVGRTDYCVEPLGEVETIRSVGGTKSFDVAAVQALRPDLVLANKEENSRPLVQALMSAGLAVHVSFPCTVDESLGYLDSLGLLLGVDADDSALVMKCRTAVKRTRREHRSTAVPVFVPIWKDPWMTFDGRAYASDVLEICGAHNVFSGRPRLYPLAADLGKTRPRTGQKVDARDTRYPRIRLEEVIERGARAVLLPDEPYAFSEDDATAFQELDVSPSLLVEPVDGKDLFWYGTRVAGAVARIRDQVERLRSVCFGGYPNN
ncbi:MAG: helical backbone metal receptor [Myxococcales bacterium]|nr:helical backbone metal receptor [Myxococcales bacterium]